MSVGKVKELPVTSRNLLDHRFQLLEDSTKAARRGERLLGALGLANAAVGFKVERMFPPASRSATHLVDKTGHF